MNYFSGPRDFICETCGAGFGCEIYLKRHKVTHGELKFICSYCGRKHKRSSELLNHIKRTHKLIKNHKCNQCEKAYFDPKCLKHHIALVHMGIRYQCQVQGCTSSLSRKDAYVTHLKSHNLNESEMKDLMQKCEKFRLENNLI
jgi:uncharacterized Zn-finger protein